MSTTERYVLIFMLCIKLWISDVQAIYSTPTVFYSQFCSLYYVGTWTGPTFDCPATVAQTGIIRSGLVLAQHTKNYYSVSKFTASLTDPAPSASSFTINYVITEPYAWLRLGFFVVLIKTQTTQKYIDLIPFSWNSGTALDNNNAYDRTITQSLPVTTLTIFTGGTAGLQITPFTTAFTMRPPYNWGVPVYTTVIEFKVSASFSGTNAVISLTAYSETQLQSFSGVALIINPPEIAVAVSNKFHMAYLNNPYTMGKTLDFSSFASLYGPNFDNKCILGINNFKHNTVDHANYYFRNSWWGFYDTYQTDTNTSPVLQGIFFCFGNSTQCGQAATYWDKIDGDCYQPAKCPLPVPSGWAPTDMCPNCTQLICLNCTVTNRSNCLSCEVNSTLTGGICVCNPNYYGVNTTISTSTQGQWNNVANSLTKCLLNCTAVIPKCSLSLCSNATFCDTCMTGYILNLYAPDKQNCLNCSQAIPHCLTCTVLTACTLCQPGYYIIPASGSAPGFCDLCINEMSFCLTCSNDITCLTCQTGYKVNTTTKFCMCDVAANPLTYCLTCTIPTECTNCISNLYFLNSTDKFCYICTTFDLMCIQCSANKFCTLCQTGYIVKVNNDGTALCVLCSLLIPNCTTCSSPTVCTNCDTFYGLNSINQCQLCDQLLMPGCLTCENDQTCLSCGPSFVLINGACIECDKEIYKCNLCDLDLASNVNCLQCDTGFYIQTAACLTCLNRFDYCNECTATTCFSCLTPYLLGPDGRCSQCIEGYWLIQGLCMNIAGCIKSTTLPDGTQICIACAQILNFIYDKRIKKCICAEGFQESIQKGQLMSCVAVCGDGIVSSSYQECDDKNTQSNDGCDSACKVEKDFICTTDQPSKCTLQINFDNIAFNFISRVLGQNKGIMSFTIEPQHQGLQKLDWSTIMKFNFNSSIVDKSNLKFSYSSITGELLVTVPYNQQLQNFDLLTIITFDPKIVISQPATFYLSNKLNGINVPLVFEDDSIFTTTQSINIISTVLIVLLLLQFYLGSYFHKMIGLQTIQVIQSIYFVRMIAPSASTSVLSSINIIQYSACGYQNAQIIYGDLQNFNTRSMGLIATEFNAINMKQFFLLNANLSLIPVLLALIFYVHSLARKYYSRNKYIEIKEQQEKDIYTEKRRKSQWAYDHFFFPFVMMFNLISFFFIIQELTKHKSSLNTNQQKKMHQQSFLAHVVMTFLAGGIYCYEAIISYEEYTKYRMTLKQKQKMSVSLIQKLQHDQNNIDRPNYHPAYVLVYLIYYLLLSLVMIISVLIKSFSYNLQLTLGLSAAYFILIWVWKPYHKSINLHNLFLRVYYGTFVLFLVICYMFSKIGKLQKNIYITLMYVIMILIGLILTIGFVRIVIEKIFRSKLQNDNTILYWDSPNQKVDKNEENQQKSNELAQALIQVPTKKQVLMLNNPFVFQNQLTDLGKKYGLNNQQNMGSLQLPKKQKNKKVFSKQQEDFIVSKIRQQINSKRQNLFLESLLDPQVLNQNFQVQQPITDKILQKYDPPFISNLQSNSIPNNSGRKHLTIQQQKQLKLVRLKLKNQLVVKKF